MGLLMSEHRLEQLEENLSRILSALKTHYKPEQVIVFKVSAWDTNCPQHIPQKFDAADVAAALAARDARIAELEAELAAMRGEASSSGRAI